MEDRRIYKVIEGSPAWEAVALVEHEVKQARTRWNAFTEKYRPKDMFYSGNKVGVIVYINDSIPEHIEKVPFRKLMVPVSDEARQRYALQYKRLGEELLPEYALFKANKRTKEGKLFVKELEDLTDNIKASSIIANGRHYAAQFFNGETWIAADRCMHYPTMQKIDEVYIISVHRNCKAVPMEGLAEIKLSEYYALKNM